MSPHRIYLPGMEVLGELGRGAHSVVYRVRREGRLYAVKMPRRVEGEDGRPGLAERFRREAVALARARHPALPEVMEVGEAEGVPYLVMELVSGEPLDRRLERGPLSEQQTLQLGRCLASALRAIHKCGLVHRDVKPRNILFEAEGSQVRLVDFGFAVEADASPGIPGLVGTRIYAAPEQLLATLPIDGRADLFALGCVLYECLAGKPPFGDVDSRRFMRQSARVAAPTLADAVSNVQPDLIRLTTRLLARDPDDRYPSADLLLHDIERLQRCEPLASAAKVTPGWRVPEPDPGVTPTPLLGRAPDIELLREVWLDASENHARVVTLQGAPGVGKTRLAAELLSELRSSNAAVLCASCDAADPRPFAAVRDLLEAFLRGERHGSSVSTEEAANHLRALAGDFAPLIRVLSPILAEVFRDARPMPSTDEAHKVFVEGLAEFLSRLLRALGPVVVFIDNAHWLDSGSRRVIARAVDHLTTGHALLILASRTDAPGRSAPALPRGLEPHRVLHIELQPLQPPHVGELVRAYLGGGKLDTDVVRCIEGFTDYTPLSVLELVRTMLDSGALVFFWGSWQLDRAAIARLRLPSQTAELVANRIEALDPRTQQTLATAAVLGPLFSEDLLVRVSDLDAAQTRAALSDARRAALIESDAQGSHRFLHDVVREGLLEKLTPEARRAIHQRVAEELDVSFEKLTEVAPERDPTSLVDMDRYYVLASHYAHGETRKSPRRVFETNVAAGGLAFRSFDNDRAVEFFEIAASAAALLGRELGPELEFTIAEARFRSGALEKGREQFQRILGRTDDPILRARAYLSIAQIHEATLDTGEAWRALEEAFHAMGKRPPTRSLLSIVLALFAWIKWALLPSRTGAPTGTHRHVEVVVALYDEAARLAFQSGEPLRFLVAALACLGLVERLGPSAALALSYQRYAFVLVMFGMKTASLRHMRRGQAIAETIHDAAVYAHLLQLQSVFLSWIGDIPGAINRGARLLDEYGHWRELTEYCLMACNQQLLESVRGRSGVAWGWGRRAVQRMAQYQGTPVVPEFIALRARATLYAVGRDIEARGIVDRLREITISTPADSALGLLVFGPRVAVYAESGRLGEEFEAIVRDVRAAHFNPRRVHLAMTEYYIHVAHARIHQCLRAAESERQSLISELRGALSDLTLAARVPLLVAHQRAVRAYFRWFTGNTRAAERDFAVAERLGREQGAPWVLYAVHRGRAHVLRAQGLHEAARDEARIAETLARTHSAAHRLRWIREEFELKRIENEASPQPIPLSPDSESSPVAGLVVHAPAQLRSVLQVARAQHAELDPERQARTIVDELVRALHAERGYLYLTPSPKVQTDPHNDPPPLRLVAGRDDRQRDVSRADLDVGVFQQLMRRGAAYIVEPAADQSSSNGTGNQIRVATIAAPLVLEGAVVGVVRLDRRVGLGEFTEEEAELLNALACQVPLALELMRSLSARGRLEEHERTAQKMEAVARMAGGIAHDFNNMLSAIRTSTEAVLAEPGLTEAAAEDVRTIQSAADRAEELTGHLLAFARSQYMEPQVVLLQGLVERAAPVLRKLVGSTVDLKIELDSDLYPVKVDRSQLDRILANLATNARDAMPQGGRVTVSARNVTVTLQDSQRLSGLTPGAYAMLSVSDTGHGIDPSIREKIFDPFFTTKVDKGGTGLGLATTYGIVKQSGGTIEVESEAGRGTTFKIYMPKTSEPFREETPRERQPTRLQGSETLLLVEDEPLVNHAMSRLLRRKGYHVMSARGGSEALQMAQQVGGIDLLITDVMMPDMNGVELARELRKVQPDLKVLYTSGYNAGVVGDRDIWGARAEFLQKPVRPDVLVGNVRRLLDLTADR